MTAKTTRILKEARPLFWPWCAVALAGVLPLVQRPDWIARISPVVFALGIPLLAALSMGNEFQHRTLSLLLSQPIDRMEMWGEKLSVTAIAVLSAVLVISVSLWAAGLQTWQPNPVSAGAWIVAAVASATFWTLFTKSTLGSVAITVAVQGFIALAGMVYRRASWGVTPGLSVAALLCYGGVMLWLGRRAVARFQVTGGMAGDDLLTAGPDVMPGALAGWLRCRPTGAVLNLMRKELCLLRPVWLFTLLAALSWTCLTLFRLVHHQGPIRNFEIVVVSLGVICTLMIAILAGGLSLGEERSSGTHAWHLTLPVSALRQWLTKLFIAVFAGLVGAALLPELIAGSFLFGPSRVFPDVHFGTAWLLGILLLTFAAFWCACAVNGTVPAVLLVIPVTTAMGFASYFAKQFGQQLVEFVVASRFNPYANFRIAWEVARVTLGNDYRYPNLFDRLETPMTYAMIVGGPALLLAIIQSYRLFCTQVGDSTRSVARSLLPLAMMVFLCGSSLTVFNSLVDDARWPVRGLIGETGMAIEKILPLAAKLDPTQPLHLTFDDVVEARKAFPFSISKSTRRWLRDARITVTPGKAHPDGFYCVEHPGWSTWCYYSATIHLADGTDLTQSWEPQPNYPEPGHYSVYAHCPGAKGQESLFDR